GVYGVALAGWSSNSKYSLLGGLRASAQMVSYEICLGLSLVGVLIVSGTFSLRGIVEAQSGHFLGFIPKWNIFYGCQFIAFFIYLMAAYAETNRIPLDLPEAETELVAGYHTEYSAMKFAMFFMAEYANMITVACLATLLFLGGWSGPVFGPPLLVAILPTFWFVAKILVFLFIYIWVRGTLPRFRYDQLMAFGWKLLFPLAIANLVATALIGAYRASMYSARRDLGLHTSRNVASGPVSAARRDLRSGRHQSAGAVAPHKERAVAGGGHGFPASGEHALGRRVCGGRAGDRVRRR